MRAFLLFVALLLASAAAESAEAQILDLDYRIWTEVYPALDTASYAYLEEFFDHSGVLLIAADKVERHMALRKSMVLAAGECGETNSKYLRNQNFIIICYEMVDAILRQLHDGTADQRSMSAAWAIEFLIFHELGHKLVHEFGLRVSTGGKEITAIRDEEEAVDQFAALSMMELEAAAPLAMGVYFARWWMERAQGHTLALSGPSTHPTHEQRFWNLACWTYGSDTTAFSSLRASLPPARAPGCAQEYRAISTRWTGLLAPHRRRVPTARRGSIPTLGSFARPLRLPNMSRAPVIAVRSRLDTRMLTGEWSFTERLGRKGRRPTCENTGTFSVRRDDDATPALTFRGIQGCEALMATDDEGDQRDVSGPIYSINGIVFIYVSPCLYSGTLSRDGTRLRGTLRCVVMGLSGQPERFAGTWEAVRQ